MAIVSMMRYREFLKSRLGEIVPEDVVLPAGFHVVGHVALVHLNSALMKYASLLGNATLEYDHRLKSVAARVGPTNGVERRPAYTVIAGSKDTTTIHTENGVHFRLDPIRVTFSGGNKGERIGISKRVGAGECVVDMFACVGQFALHIAKRNEVRVVAIEINPDAYRFLVESIKMNGLEHRVSAILGDCRIVHPAHIANCIIMGYLHGTEEFLPYALDTLVEDGGVIHMHRAAPERALSRIITRITEICREREFVSDIEMRKIKNYSPGVRHLVFDISVCSS